MHDSEPIALEADPALIQRMNQGRVPDGWVQRALYTGPRGAEAWLCMMAAAGYGKNPHRDAMRAQLVDAVAGARARAFVSLGPGDGEPDFPLVVALAKSEPALEYIPVDLNEALLRVAGGRMQGAARVPFGLVADFESGMPFVRARLKEHRVSSAVYGLLGSTLSNLDRGESHFLDQLHQTLQADDTLLVEVATRQPGWTFETDMRAHHASYERGERQLVANGIAVRTGEAPADVERDFEARVAFRRSSGQVPGAGTIEVVDTKSGLVGLRYGRYELSELVAWLKTRGWSVAFEKTYSVAGVTIGMSALRLHKQRPA